MPLMSARILRERAAAGVVVCLTHGPLCKKHPDHPAVQERRRQDIEFGKDLVEVIRKGQPRSWLKQLADAGYELPEEFARMDYHGPPQPGRAEAFIERYDLAKHFRSDELEVSSPDQCKTRKLSDDELRQRKEWATEVKAVRQKKGIGEPIPPWEEFTPEELKKLRKALGQGIEDNPEARGIGEQIRRKREAENAARIARLKADEELGRKLREALATWVSLPSQWSAHTQDVREGYGDAVPEFEESE